MDQWYNICCYYWFINWYINRGYARYFTYYIFGKCRLYYLHCYHSHSSSSRYCRYYLCLSGTYCYTHASISRWYMEQQQSSYSLSRLGYRCCYCSICYTSPWHSNHYLHNSRGLYHYYYFYSTSTSSAHHGSINFLRRCNQHPQQCYSRWCMDEWQPSCSLYRIGYRCSYR